MDTTLLFYLIQTIAVVIFLTLAVYVALNRSSRDIQLPFIAFALIEAFNAYALFVLRSPGGPPDVIPVTLKLRWALLSFLPGIFLHLYTRLLPMSLHRRARLVTFTAYTLASLTSIAAFTGDDLISGMIHRGPEAADILDPIFNLNGIFLVALWILPTLAILTLFIIYASRPSRPQRSQTNARGLYQPWTFLLLAALFGGISVYQSSNASPSFVLVLALIERLLSIAAGLLLTRAILQFGSHFRRSVDPRLAIVILPVVTLVIVDFLAIYNSENLSSPLHLAHLLLISLIAGTVLARPELPRLIAQWIGPHTLDGTLFTVRLSLAWESLAEGTFNFSQISETILALQDALGATYVGVLEVVDMADQSVQIFGRYDDGPRLTIDADHLDWPLTKESLDQVEYQISGIPGPPSIILPIHDDHKLAGILVIGETHRGSIYGRRAIQSAHLLTAMLSFAIRRGFLIQETTETGPNVDIDTFSLPDVAVVIRTFGRLEIFTQLDDSRTTHPSLRARQILAILLSTYPDPVASDTLMERLWPEQSPKSASNSLYVAIYALRRSLEPDLKRGEVSHYVLREGDYYRLVIDDNVWVDFLEFLQFYWEGRDSLVRSNERRARRSYEHAIRICRRPFLADATLDLPTEVEVTRHRLQRFMHEMVWYLTDVYIRKEKWAEAERVLLHLLSIDHHDHEARDMLTDIYQRQGKNGLAEQLRSLGKENVE
jgi:DNA-binding SARP family transcriptional activator